MIIDIVNEIDSSLKIGNNYSALVLSLLLPDICGKILYPNLSEGVRYKKWYSEYIGKYYMPNDNIKFNDEKVPWISADLLYSLRCSVVHEGIININKNDIKQCENKIDKFVVNFNLGKHVFSNSSIDKNGPEIRRSYEINGLYLCNILREVAYNFYCEGKYEK